jgi:DNA-directed RNA polymerase I subunit RPA1
MASGYAGGGVKADPADAIVRQHVRRVEFGWYTDEDTRRRSVVEVTSPVAFVETTAIRHGLYDPRMGPSDGKETMPCETCGNRYLTCPGHFGAVELCVPVYQPLLLPDLMAVLASKCFFCHRLKQHQRQLWQAHAKVLLLLHHRVADYQDFDAHLARIIHQAGQDQLMAADPTLSSSSNNTAAWKHAAKTVRERAVEQACHAIISELQDKPLPLSSDMPATQTQWSLMMALRKQLLKEWKAVPQCRHCSAFNPKIKHDQHNKLFQAKLSDKQARVNMAGNLQLKPATQKATTNNSTTTATSTTANYDDSDQDTVMSERNPYVDDEAMEVNDDDEDDDEDDEEEEEEDDDGDKPRRRHNKKPASTKTRRSKDKTRTTAVNDDDDDDDDKNDTTTTTTDIKTPKQFYMPPTEVMAQCQLTWHHHGPLLSTLLFAGKSPITNLHESYRVFFCQVVAVPPNRYRPPMNMGAMRVEHAQNLYLNQILVENAHVRETLFAASASVVTTTPTNSNNSNKNNKLLEKGHSHWIQLQTSFNCFMDCTKDPAYTPATAPKIAKGIRQLLEKKEGLFRKHMMGKRVDSACRSVISPDPYVGTNEIGIPMAFAKTLTYPTPVTEWNATELRMLVERGPHNYPGAKWVEIPRPGNKVMRVELQRMNPEKRRAVAAMLLKESKARARPVVVGRQLRQGDVMLVNRQVRVSCVCSPPSKNWFG